ncbi:hypothetical protein H2198_003521 [Neophaeococcomyces mojaviensis]|uniref:Uncharacterized protein n=1 Tax=Neophaeococcomyces mojaviensis TaxID=3383035 RepID=A0ACC3AB86_9EURO|nr:hypothetical protein H2198_003521 [Knufia sp. JES_112]
MAVAWAIPVGVLAGLCVAMFIFIWWWFPRHYKKGIAMDMAMYDEQRQERELAQAQANADGNAADAPAGNIAKPQITHHTYVPPAYTSY